jgi:hypothetical protein
LYNQSQHYTIIKMVKLKVSYEKAEEAQMKLKITVGE